MTALFAFLHHLAAFALVGAIAVEFALARGTLNAANARRLLRPTRCSALPPASS